MDFQLACSLADLVISVGAKRISLLGGEPTLWTHLLEFNGYVSSRIGTTLVSNAVRFAEDDFLAPYSQKRNEIIGVSLKASSKKKYDKIGCKVSWEEVTLGIKNALEKLSGSLGFVCSPNDCDLVEVAKTAKDLGASRLNLSLYTPIFNGERWESDYSWEKLKEMTREISLKWHEAENILSGGIYLRCSYPLCMWPEGFIEKLAAEDRVYTGCLLSQRQGLVFDTDGSVLVCNHLYPYSIGKFGVDFSTSDQFLEFLRSDKVTEIYNKASCYPSVKCQNCRRYSDCTGGCSVLWLYFNPADSI